MGYMKEFDEIACVGACIGVGFENTSELYVMKYEAAMNSPDAAQWKKAVEEEQQRMEEMAYGVLS
jgi:ABC-type long-subunit fatty acid transport system fused permease/ATPase subunit